MIKIIFDVEYGIVTNKSMEETMQQICEQLNIDIMQIKNVQIYNMNDLDIIEQKQMEKFSKKQLTLVRKDINL